MELKKIERLVKKANDRRLEEEKDWAKIKNELKKITGISQLEVCFLPSDGLGIGLEVENDFYSAPLSSVLDIIKQKGTVTEEEIFDLTFF